VLPCVLWQMAGWAAAPAKSGWRSISRASGRGGRCPDHRSACPAVSSAFFVVPGALGVQEGAFLIFGGLVGLTPEIALALALARSGRDLLIFGPPWSRFNWSRGAVFCASR